MSRAFGPLTATTPTGEPLANATVAFKESDGTTALAQALFAANSGGSSTTTHTTNAKGQLNRYPPFAQRAYYTLNGDSAIWPIDFDVDPADICAMGPDGVTVTQGYRAVARMRIAAVEGKLRDRGGFCVNVEAYAEGVTINNGAADGTGGDPTTAIQAAQDALHALGGGTLEWGPGTFLYPTSLTFYDNIVWRGTRGKTVLMHRPNSSVLINALNVSNAGFTNVGFVDLEFNGNYDNNLDFNATSSELAFTGTDCFLFGCTVRNFNAFGVQFGGTRTVVAFNRVLGPNNGAGLASYASLDTFPNRYAGRDGLFTPGNLTVKSALVHGNYVSGLRLPAMFIGGTGLICTSNHVENCHRSYGFLVDGVTHTGGGMIGTALTKTTVDLDTQVRDFVIADNYVGPVPVADVVTLGSYAIGIELDTCFDGVVANNTIMGAPVYGISLHDTQRVSIMGGSIRGCGTASYSGGSGGLRVADNTSKFTVMGVIFGSNSGTGIYAIHLAGTTNHYGLFGNVFEGNTTNLSNTASGTNYRRLGNVTIDGDPIPDVASLSAPSDYVAAFANTSATGYGIRVQSGATSSQFNYHGVNSNGDILFDVYGNGLALHRSSDATDVLRLDATHASVGLYSHLVVQRNAVNKARLGLDTNDNLAVLNAAGDTAVVAFSPSTGRITADQGTDDTQLLILQSTGDVAHGMTTVAPTSAYGQFSKFSGANGGLNIEGFDDTGAIGMRIAGYATTTNTTINANSAAGAILLDAYLKNGTGVQTLGTGNLLAVRNNGLAEFVVRGDGNIYFDGTSNAGAWDEHDDVQLLEAFRRVTAPGVERNFTRLFTDQLAEHADVLAATGVIERGEDGQIMVSTKGLNALVIDSIRQTYGRLRETQSDVAALSRQVRALTAAQPGTSE